MSKALVFSACLLTEQFLLERQISHDSIVLRDFEGNGFLPCHTAAQNMSNCNLTFPFVVLEARKKNVLQKQKFGYVILCNNLWSLRLSLT